MQLADTPLHLEYERFLWNEALAKFRQLFPHWDKRDAGLIGYLHGLGEVLGTSFMLNESLLSACIQYVLMNPVHEVGNLCDCMNIIR